MLHFYKIILFQGENSSSSGINNKMPEAKADTISLIHFNDVYNVEGREVEPVGGASRFLTAVKSVSKECNPLILFSGDIFAPSISKFEKNFISFFIKFIFSEYIYKG